ncbi:MAG: CHASE domain-containing protein, partial [Planctomycetales bacterium]|nr:CHASE domain-containing protein [Planctomycetales bacterium]
MKRYLLQFLALAVAYLAAGRLAYLLAIPPGYASPIWPAAGIAVAGLMICGSRLWPAVFAGAFVTSISAYALSAAAGDWSDGLLTALAVGAGATLQALVGCTFTKRFEQLAETSLGAGDIARWMITCGPVACLINATVGVGSLYLSGAIATEQLAFNWFTWWIGDSAGVLVFAPVLLCVFRPVDESYFDRIRLVAIPTLALCGCLLTFFTFLQRHEESFLQTQFQRDSERIASQIHRHVFVLKELTLQLGAFFDGSEHVDRNEFHQFLSATLKRHPDVVAMEWAPRVASAGRSEFEQAVSKDLHAPFEITEIDAQGGLVPAARRDFHVPVKYAEPHEANLRVLGLDLASEELRACDTGTLAVSPPITIVQDDEVAVMMFHPVFRRDMKHNARETPCGDLLGFVITIFRVDQFLDRATSSQGNKGIQLQISDETTLAGDGPTNAHGSFVVHRFREDEDEHFWKKDEQDRASGPVRFCQNHDLDIGGRHWHLETSATDRYAAGRMSWGSWSVLALGLLLTALLEGVLLYLSGTSERTRREVEKRTEELNQAKQELERHTDELERKNHETEAALQRAEDASDELTQINKALQDMNRASEAATQAKTQFLANMSHEIRTPMTAILGYTDLLAEKIVERDQRGMIETIQRNGQHLLELINDVLDLSKVEAGKVQVEQIACSPTSIVRDVVALFNPRAEAKGLELRAEFSEELPEY